MGTVRSKQRAVVEAKISGRVLEYSATPGTIVKAGDLLARLDVQEIQAKVDQARAMLDQAQRDFDRQNQLIASKATTRQDFDTAGQVGFTSAPRHWAYAGEQGALAATHAVLETLCDIRTPVSLTDEECDLIATIVAEALETVIRARAEAGPTGRDNPLKVAS